MRSTQLCDYVMQYQSWRIFMTYIFNQYYKRVMQLLADSIVQEISPQQIIAANLCAASVHLRPSIPNLNSVSSLEHDQCSVECLLAVTSAIDQFSS